MAVTSGTDSGHRWVFAKTSLDDVGIENSVDDHWKGMDPGESAIVELVQNGSDDPDEDVSELTLRVEEIEAATLAPWFEELLPHLEGAGLDGALPLAGAIRLLICSDTNVGLEGDPQARLSDLTSNDRFAALLRATGKSNREAGSNGSTGNGKETYFRLSDLNAFLVLTRTRSSIAAGKDEMRLAGMARTMTHRVGGVEFKPYGRFVAAEDGPAGGMVPVTDAGVVAAFCTAFGIRRGSKESGTDIVIPAVGADVTGSRIVEWVLRHYWVPLQRGELRIIVEAADISTGVKLLDESTVLEELKELNDDRLLALYETYAAYLSGTTEPVGGRLQLANGTIELDADDDRREQLRAALAAGDVAEVDVEVTVSGNNGDETGHATVLLRERAKYSGHPHYQRDGLSIDRVRTNRHLTRGYLSIIDARDDALAKALRLAEPPAHETFEVRSAYSKAGHSSTLLLAHKRLARLTLDAINDLGDEPDLQTAAQFFSLPTTLPGTQSDLDRDRDSDLDPDSDPDFDPPPAGFRIRIADRAGGFVVSLPDHPDRAAVRAVEIDVAYAVRRGNPFSKWRPLDFELSDPAISISVDGGTVRAAEGNHLVIDVHEPETLRAEVIGFDNNRALRINAESAS
jgi:hypothetical protein